MLRLSPFDRCVSVVNIGYYLAAFGQSKPKDRRSQASWMAVDTRSTSMLRSFPWTHLPISAWRSRSSPARSASAPTRTMIVWRRPSRMSPRSFPPAAIRSPRSPSSSRPRVPERHRRAEGTTSPETVLVVGAHYDTVRTTPGPMTMPAAWRASWPGAALREQTARKDRAVRRVPSRGAAGVPDEEHGSYHYASSLKKARERVDGMICLEMIGFFCDRSGSQHYPIPFMNLKFRRPATTSPWWEPEIQEVHPGDGRGFSERPRT